MISNKNFYIITSTKSNKLEEKRVVSLLKITMIKTHETDKGRMQICVKDGDDEVIESFERNQIALHIQKKAKQMDHKIIIKKVNHIILKTRKDIITGLFMNSAVVNNAIHEVFQHADKVGHLKLVSSGLLGSNIKDYTMVLSNLGIMYFSTNQMTFKGFIPILGVKLRKNRLGGDNSINVLIDEQHNKSETMIFGSDFEMDEWYDCIEKVITESKERMLARQNNDDLDE